MGALGDAALGGGRQGGRRHPGALVEREIAHPGLTELHEVKSMHERKAMMADRSDGFSRAAGRGGHAGGDVRDLDLGAARPSPEAGRPAECRRLLRSAAGVPRSSGRERFMRREHRDMLIVESDPERLLDRFETYRRASRREVDSQLASDRRLGSDEPGLRDAAPAGRARPLQAADAAHQPPDQRPRRSAGSRCRRA